MLKKIISIMFLVSGLLFFLTSPINAQTPTPTPIPPTVTPTPVPPTVTPTPVPPTVTPTPIPPTVTPTPVPPTVTPTPVPSEGCDGEFGKAFGLCNAFCEAMECGTENQHASDAACERVKIRYMEATGKAKLPCEP